MLECARVAIITTRQARVRNVIALHHPSSKIIDRAVLQIRYHQQPGAIQKMIIFSSNFRCFEKKETVSQIFSTVSQNPQSGKCGVNCGYITITKIHWNLPLRRI